ncbi:MAG TPA: DUF6391 domain-containing protein [Caldilineaceae bacterium]|nr:DUF6391 domain-containing protein [Caldilineaceae bacterium]
MIDDLLYLIRRTRQHHAIEHATLHVMSKRPDSGHLSGLSDPFGFTIFGETDLEKVRRGVGDALLRLQAGEEQLAIHPNCGTNLVTTGLLVTLAALAAGTKHNPLERLVTTLLWVLPMIVAGKVLGMRLQQFTTLAQVADRWVIDIYPVRVGSLRAYRVIFE